MTRADPEVRRSGESGDAYAKLPVPTVGGKMKIRSKQPLKTSTLLSSSSRSREIVVLNAATLAS